MRKLIQNTLLTTVRGRKTCHDLEDEESGDYALPIERKAIGQWFEAGPLCPGHVSQRGSRLILVLIIISSDTGTLKSRLDAPFGS